MVQKKVKISANIEGREVALIVQIASKFKSTIKIELQDKIVNAKSIMGIIVLGDLYEQEITIIADGNDEEEAVKELEQFLTK